SGGPAIDALLAGAKARRQAVAVLVVDLDNFKQINDLNGHTVGDSVLATTAQRIRDLLPEDGVLARIGGDEFACALLHEPGRRELADRFAEQLIEALSASIEQHGPQVEATVSRAVTSSEDEGYCRPGV